MLGWYLLLTRIWGCYAPFILAPPGGSGGPSAHPCGTPAHPCGPLAQSHHDRTAYINSGSPPEQLWFSFGCAMRIWKKCYFCSVHANKHANMQAQLNFIIEGQVYFYFLFQPKCLPIHENILLWTVFACSKICRWAPPLHICDPICLSNCSSRNINS